MGKISFTIPDELEERFREKVFQTLGMRKGNISRVLENLIREWVKKGK